ncbi:MAG: redoxin domain-containing protein [Chloroflexi bacterium]|nr:redoxin domain-containing protein [Chloroflexota bacterium]MCH8194611.1 redoxin domain-containing protein [Chloroflexota bacterium]
MLRPVPRCRRRPSHKGRDCMSVEVGDKAPDFTLQSHLGEKVSLSQYKGKTVVLGWFPLAFTGG